MSNMSFNKIIASGIVGWAGDVLGAPGLEKALEGLSWVLFVWATE